MSYQHHISRLEARIANLEHHIAQQASSIEKMWHRHTELMRVGTVSLAPDDTGNAQCVQVKLNDMQTLNSVPSVMTHGFSSAPMPGALGIVLCPHGNTSDAFIVATHDASSRPRGLKPGEVQMYDSKGSSIKMDSSGNFTILANNNYTVVANGNGTMLFQSTLDITVPTMTIHGDLNVIGSLKKDGVEVIAP